MIRLAPLSLVLLAAAIPAQTPNFEIGSFDNGPTSPPVWGQTTDGDEVLLRYDELQGEYTLLMVHTTVDVSVAGQLVARGVINAMPSMLAVSDTWSLTSPELVAVNGATWSGEKPVIPPRRVAAYVQEFRSQTTPPTTWGTYNLGPNPTESRTWAPGAAVPTLQRVERYASAGVNHRLVAQGHLIDCSNLGFRSVTQSAYEYHHFMQLSNLGQLDPRMLTSLDDFLSNQHGYEIYVQAIHIKPTSSNSVLVRFSKHVKLRRRSLQQAVQNLWLTLKGPARSLPYMLDADTSLYFGPRGDEAHFVFLDEVATFEQPSQLIAYFPTADGLVAVNQTPNPVDNNQLLCPEIAIFEVPEEAQMGVVLFAHQNSPLIPFAPPVGAVDGGGFLIAFDPHPGHILE